VSTGPARFAQPLEQWIGLVAIDVDLLIIENSRRSFSAKPGDLAIGARV
jgi:hypothetical protein